MALARFWLAGTLRRHRRDALGVVLLLGLLGGLSLGSLAGARRTQSAYPRFLRGADASTMAVNPGRYDPAVDATIAARPEVVASATYVAFNTGALIDGRPDFDQDFETLGTFDGRFFTMDRFTPTSGRLPDVGRVDEVAVNETAAQTYGYHIGQVLDLGTYSDDQLSDPSFYDDPVAPRIETEATIVGVGLFTDEVIQDDTNRSALVLVTPAFSRLAAPYATYAWQGLQLRNGSADVASLTSWYVDQLDPGSPQFLRVTSVDTFHAEQAIRPLALALAVFGMIAGSATIVLVSQAVARWIRQARTDQDVLRAIGAETRQLVVTGVQAPLLALAAGSSAALVVAYLASMAMPIGAVRRVEPSPGLDADWTVFIVGGGVMFAILTVLAVATAWRDLARRPRHGGAGALRSRVVQAANALNLPPTVVTGLRHAFEPGDGAPGEGGSVRSVMVGSAVAIAMVSATLTFGASFRTLLDSPDLFGWDWDATIFDGGGYGSLDLAAAHEVFDSRPEIDGWSGAYFGADSLDGRNVPLLGMDPGSTVFPPLSSGRMIESADEIVLGSATSSSIDRRVGDQVTIGAGANGTTLNVVGIATFPTVGILHGAHTSLGVGGLVVPGLVPGFDRRASGEGPPGTGPGPVGPPVILVRFTPGADAHRAQALVSDAAIRLDPTGAAYTVDALRPAEIVNSVEVGRVPALLAAALAAAAAVSLSVALGASVRRRRRDFAVLQSLGLTRRQIAASVAWEATATVTVGLLVGIPGGIALGRWLWVGFAGQLDVVRQASMPGGLLVGVGLGAVGAANLAAAIPARSARRIRPALVLRIK